MAEDAQQARRGAVMVHLWEDALRRISPALLAPRRDCVKRVTAFFTDGKDHPTWRSAGIAEDATATGGVTVRVINTGADMELRATVSVDVAVAAGPRQSLSLVVGLGGGPPRTSAHSVRQRFREARRNTMTTLVHELRHVLSSWTNGLVPGTNRNLEEVLYAAAHARDGYMNAFEREAFAFARDWMAANGARVDDGAFDDLLPIDIIRAYAPG